MEGYCIKCGSRLYPDDAKYVEAAGVCSYCVTNDTTPDHRYKKMYAMACVGEEMKRKAQEARSRIR